MPPRNPAEYRSTTDAARRRWRDDETATQHRAAMQPACAGQHAPASRPDGRGDAEHGMKSSKMWVTVGTVSCRWTKSAVHEPRLCRRIGVRQQAWSWAAKHAEAVSHADAEMDGERGRRTSQRLKLGVAIIRSRSSSREWTQQLEPSDSSRTLSASFIGCFGRPYVSALGANLVLETLRLSEPLVALPSPVGMRARAGQLAACTMRYSVGWAALEPAFQDLAGAGA